MGSTENWKGAFYLCLPSRPSAKPSIYCLNNKLFETQSVFVRCELEKAGSACLQSRNDLIIQGANSALVSLRPIIEQARALVDEQ